jgi:hypothetical protein
MAINIAQELSAIEDPKILAIYLKALCAARCKIGGAKEGTCKECFYRFYNCKQLNDVCNQELKIFELEKESQNEL